MNIPSERWAAAVHDATLASAFVRVAGLLARPESLLRPGVALRVLLASLRPAAKTHGRLGHRDAVRAAQTFLDREKPSSPTR